MAGIFEIGPTTLVQAVNFTLLLGVLKFVLYDPLKQAIRERQEKVHKILREAENVNNQAKLLKSQYEDKLRKAQEDAQAVHQKMLEYTEAQREERVKTLENELSGMRDKAQADLQIQQEKALAELKQQVGELAIAMTSRLLTGLLQPPIQQQMLQSLIKQLEGKENGL